MRKPRFLFKIIYKQPEWHHLFISMFLKLIICQTVQTEATEVAVILIKVSPNTGRQKTLQQSQTPNVPMLNTEPAMAAKAIPDVHPTRDANEPQGAMRKISEVYLAEAIKSHSKRMAFVMQGMRDLALYRKIKKLLWLRISRHLVCLCGPELSSGTALPYHSAGRTYLPAINNRFSKGHQ
jgi:hypothetical protein